jgi:hypothetical protein
VAAPPDQPCAEPITAAAEACDEAAPESHHDHTVQLGQTMTQHDYHVRCYLLALGTLCLEVMCDPRLLPTFIAILDLARTELTTRNPPSHPIK